MLPHTLNPAIAISGNIWGKRPVTRVDRVAFLRQISILLRSFLAMNVLVSFPTDLVRVHISNFFPFRETSEFANWT